MISSYFGLKKNPFDTTNLELLPHQENIFQIAKVHAQIGGLNVIVGEPGTGKSVIKSAFTDMASKNTNFVIATVDRTLHTYKNTLHILCDAFSVEPEFNESKTEKKLIQATRDLYQSGKSLITIIDEANLLSMEVLRKLRLMFESFPKNHNLILIGQPSLLGKITLRVNEDIRSRVTYSAIIQKLNPDDMKKFIYKQLDNMGLGHNTITPEATELIARASEGILRRTRNIIISALIDAVRKATKEITTDIVNDVLMQPHWRKEHDMDQS